MPIAFNDYWSRHGDDPAGVFRELPGLVPLAETPVELLQIAALVTHLAGGHLGQWSEGLGQLSDLRTSTHFDPETAQGRAIHRCEAVLFRGVGDVAASEEALRLAQNPGSPPDQARLGMLTVLAEARVNLGEIEAGAETFYEALRLAAYGPDGSDPASRGLAISANNITCYLETVADRTDAQTAFMKTTAATARTWWEIAGDWTHVKIAEYRLAMTHLAAGEPSTALEHGRKALALVDANEGSDGDRFYPWLAVGLAHLALGEGDAARHAVTQAQKEVPDWGRAELEALEVQLAG